MVVVLSLEDVESDIFDDDVGVRVVFVCVCLR